MTDRMATPPAAYCCLLAVFEGDVIYHQERCRYAAERRPQRDELVSLSEYKTEEGGQAS